MIRSRVLPIGGALVASRSGTQTALSCSRNSVNSSRLGRTLRGGVTHSYEQGLGARLRWLASLGARRSKESGHRRVVEEEEHTLLALQESAWLCMPCLGRLRCTLLAPPYPRTARCRRVARAEKS